MYPQILFVIYMKDPVPIEIGVKPVNMEVLNNDTSIKGKFTYL